MKYVYTTRRHIQLSFKNHVHTTACGMELMAVPARYYTAFFDCPKCFAKETS